MLKGHKKVGSKFIPPMMQLGSLKQTSYIDEMLPELIWLGLIHERYGYHAGARILETIVSITTGVLDNDKDERNFSLASHLDSLEDGQKKELVFELKKTPAFEGIQSSITPLVRLYDNSPLAFLEPRSFPEKSKSMVLMKTVVEKCYDNRNTPGVALYASLIVPLLMSNRIHFGPNVNPPDLNKAILEGDTPDGRKAASSLRAMGLMVFGQANTGRNWAGRFWNQNLTIFSCEAERD